METQDALEPVETQDSNLETTEQDLSDHEAMVKKAEEIAKNQEIRAKKAEKELKALKEKLQEKDTPKSNGLSAKDILAIRDLHEEDAEYLIGEAELRGKTVAEMKKDPYMSIILKTKAEERKTAEATNISGSKRGTQSLSAQQIVSAGLEGREVDPVKFAEAQMELRRKK